MKTNELKKGTRVRLMNKPRKNYRKAYLDLLRTCETFMNYIGYENWKDNPYSVSVTYTIYDKNGGKHTADYSLGIVNFAFFDKAIKQAKSL